jgi:hypothetical protein
MGGLLRLAVLFAALAVAVPAHAWDEVHAGVVREAAECVSWSSTRVDCFTRNISGALMWTYREAGKWSAAVDLGGKLAAAPNCVVRGPGGINCYAVSTKGVLATIYLNGSKWSAWSSLGGELKPARISCVGLARDRIVCFARGRGDQLMSRRWSGGKAWEPWRDLGGALTGDPECILVGGASAACFARGSRGEFVAFLPDAAGVNGGWTTLGGNIEGKPSCLRLSSGEAACAAQSRGGRLLMWRGMPVYGEGPGVLSSLDEMVAGEPACTLQGTTPVCFLRNSRHQLVRRSLGGGGDASRDGIVADAPAVAALVCLPQGADIGCALTDTERRLHYATGLALEAGVESGQAEPDARDDMSGAWYLSSTRTGEVCRVLFGVDRSLAGKHLRIGPRCRRALGLPARPVHWDRDGDALRFLAFDGGVLLRFRAVESDRWVTPWRDTAFVLTRELPGVGGPNFASGDPSQLFGSWRLFADDAGFLCTVSLTEAQIDGGFSIHWDEGCDDRLTGVRYWAESGGALVFVGQGNVVVARFDSAGPDAWRSQAMGGLTLRR